MATPTRTEAIAALNENHAVLTGLLNSLSDEDLHRPKTIGDGNWSAKNLMGHIAFWEELALEALADRRAGRRPAVEAIFEQGVDAANAEDQARWADRSPDDVRTRAKTSHETLVKALSGLSDDEWKAKAPYPTKRRETLAVLLGSILGAPKRPFDHALAHLPDLEAYVASLQR